MANGRPRIFKMGTRMPEVLVVEALIRIIAELDNESRLKTLYNMKQPNIKE